MFAAVSINHEQSALRPNNGLLLRTSLLRPSAADAAPPPRAGVRVENRPEDVLRAQAIMRNILLALLALCFGAATAAKQALGLTDMSTLFCASWALRF